jgi:hypothetical protein
MISIRRAIGVDTHRAHVVRFARENQSIGASICARMSAHAVDGITNSIALFSLTFALHSCLEIASSSQPDTFANWPLFLRPFTFWFWRPAIHWKMVRSVNHAAVEGHDLAIVVDVVAAPVVSTIKSMTSIG